LGRIFDLGVRKGHSILILGYAEGYNFDLGVRKYQKVENRCSRQLYTTQSMVISFLRSSVVNYVVHGIWVKSKQSPEKETTKHFEQNNKKKFALFLIQCDQTTQNDQVQNNCQKHMYHSLKKKEICFLLSFV